MGVSEEEDASGAVEAVVAVDAAQHERVSAPVEEEEEGEEEDEIYGEFLHGG